MISETILIGFFILEKQLANINILDRGFLFLRNTLLLYSFSPYSQTERRTESQIHSLHVGWRNLFCSCAVVSVFVLAGNRFWFYILLMYLEYHTGYGVVLVFLVLAGNCFWVLLTYLVYNTAVRLCQFFCCGGKANLVRIFLLNPNFLLVHRNKTFCYCVSLSCFVWIYNHTVTIVSQKYRELCLIV